MSLPAPPIGTPIFPLLWSVSLDQPLRESEGEVDTRLMVKQLNLFIINSKREGRDVAVLSWEYASVTLHEVLECKVGLNLWGRSI